MIETANWQFDLEVHPAGWNFPAGDTWVAGWIWAPKNRVLTDLRLWIDGRPFLAIWGLPKPGLDERFLGRPGPPYLGFTILVNPHAGASLLRLEVRDQTGSWQEIFRTAITVADGAPIHPDRPSLAPRLPELLLSLLRLQRLRPGTPVTDLADTVISAAMAEPLNSEPNPPFHGALEEPRNTGRLRYGRVAVTGWLSHRTEKIKRLTAIVDATCESILLYGLPRNDVSDLFTDLTDSAQSAFVGQVDCPSGQGAPVLLKVFAELASGEKHLVFAQRFSPEIIAGPHFPLPYLSKFRFTKSLWCLHRSAHRLGRKFGGIRSIIVAAKTAWAAYRDGAPPRPHHHSSPVYPLLHPVSPAPLRLLVVTHNLNFEGAPRLAYELARHLQRQSGNTVKVLSPQEGPLRALFEEAGMMVEIVDLSVALAATSSHDFHNALNRSLHINWNEIDLVIANTLVSFWAIHAAKQAGKPSLFYVHESAPIAHLAGTGLPPACLPLVEAAFREATRVVFTAEASRGVFAALEHQGNFRVRPSWLEVAAIEHFAATHLKATLRAKHGIASEAVVILNLGTLCERKGQHIFIRTAALLEPTLHLQSPDRPVLFVMVGGRSDQFEALLRLQAADAGLQQVLFIPETRENYDWLGLADLLVCTSFEESSPRVLLEAACFNLPIISTNVNGIPELVTEEEAWLINPGDPHQLADALSEALSAFFSEDHTRVTRARNAVVSRFDERVSLPQHHALAIEAVDRSM